MKRLGTTSQYFIGLAVLPSLVLFGVVSNFFGASSNTLVDAAPMIPKSAWYAAFMWLPLLVASTGTLLTAVLSILSRWLEWLAKPRFTIFISLVWSLVFGYLSMFLFVMSFGDRPAIASAADFDSTLRMTIWSFPHIIGISLGVCAVATAIFAACWKGGEAALNQRS